jgi:hypothetical protein
MPSTLFFLKSATGWGADVPDLLGLGVVAPTIDEVEFNFEGMNAHGDRSLKQACRWNMFRLKHKHQEASR